MVQVLLYARGCIACGVCGVGAGGGLAWSKVTLWMVTPVRTEKSWVLGGGWGCPETRPTRHQGTPQHLLFR